ncbi:hypothetical protein [Nitrosopumilus sp.]|uniref:hypothetical protein n=1 Tax=Nitrosopumilus sp. TaxID=2024843 RepID=UPI0026209AD3|nr:hypothetical protein [Nitrosopumilus sp.]
MEKFEQLLNMLMDFNSDIRFAAICDKNGEILWNSKRNNVKPLVPMADTKKTLQRAINAWEERSKIKNMVGEGLYVIAAYEKIKRITIPLDNRHILFLSVDNSPDKSSNKKSYGHLVEMGKIMSIVDFVKSQQ